MNTTLDQAKTISQLRLFFKKFLLEAGTVEKSLEIAKRHSGKLDFAELVIKDLNKETAIKFPTNSADLTEAHQIYLDLLKEVVDEVSALY